MMPTRISRVAFAGFALVLGACAGTDSAPKQGSASGVDASTEKQASSKITVHTQLAPLQSLPPSLERGKALYGVHCAVCHGVQGDGQGEAAYLLSPAPRNFASGRFRLVSTENAVPTDEDLSAVLKRGMPGSSMPAFEWMQEDERTSLVWYVRQLSEDGIVRGLKDYAEEEGETFDAQQALQIAKKRTTPGQPVALGEAPAVNAELLAHGRKLYMESCAPCHGADGRARDVEVQWNEDGTPTQPRDFTAGIFKGAPTREAIVQRLRCGLPGSPMPSTPMAQPSDAWALASYVTSLVKPGSEERVLQARRTIAVRRAANLPAEPSSPDWRRHEPTWLALMPLWWRDERIEGVELRALHDGQHIALHLSWKDATKDEEMLATESFSDLAALQFSTAADPPLFAMGQAGRPVSIWSWKAAWERERGVARDVADLHPNLSEDLYGYQPPEAAPLFLTARAVGNPMALEHRLAPGEELQAQGLGTVAPAHAGAAAAPAISVRGEWKDGSWNVVFRRSLSSADLALAPAGRAFLAAAVWDGSAQERDGQKSVTVWHVLELER